MHASAKEATVTLTGVIDRDLFSIHASAKEATSFDDNAGLPENFQSTPPRRRRRCSANLFSCCFPFSIHASAKEATICKIKIRGYFIFQSTPPRRRRPQHIVIPQLSCAYLVSTTFLSTIFSFISQYIVLFPLFRVRMPCVFCVAYDSHYVPLFNIFYILFQGTPF